MNKRIKKKKAKQARQRKLCMTVTSPGLQLMYTAIGNNFKIKPICYIAEAKLKNRSKNDKEDSNQD
ncbi:TPA: hypothetical protein U1578_001389 [Streptococcus suis]|uniref:hypothetical protein n=1 Tax=Streptococcus suis TaxID=1307 RepID=UPI0014952E09|nr:hypothetical protein [Streptococcus suis]MBS8056125.1 hypothetical protein [Streptococcus suis]MCL4942280.1 hypothetical protein [Streptococcus suis]NQN94017.1 hypothetical protein [Streptococcus suis]NQO06204.1 hypothetical protein [Streptococcus suis]NQO36647.1 hypothetical protein [Streptococcus suis]